MFIILAFRTSTVKFDMVADDFKPFLLHFWQVDLEPGVNIYDPSTVRTDEVMVGSRLRVKAHLNRIHSKFSYESSLFQGHERIINGSQRHRWELS
jgi:hypothetical protein